MIDKQRAESFCLGTISKGKIESEIQGWLKKVQPHIIKVVSHGFSFIVFYDRSGIVTTHVEIFPSYGHPVEEIDKWLEKEKVCLTESIILNDNLLIFYYKFLPESPGGYKAPSDLNNLPRPGN